MQFDAFIDPQELSGAGQIAAGAEQLGFSAIWTLETKHDPFLPLVLAASATSRLELGTSIALAFPRSPTSMAYTAWDMAALSRGRFILGLGTQVKAHIERRFAAQWGPPAEKLGDYIAAMRAVWQCWRTGERLRYEGPFYTLKLMTPFFSPDPLPYPDPPIFIAGLNRGLCRLAGQVCQGFHAHPLHTPRFLREATLPWITEGLVDAGRTRSDIQVNAPVFAILGRGAARDRAREDVRRQIAFYAATPSYRTLLEVHGWEAAGEQLTRLAARGRWDDMGVLITDEMLAEIAVEGETLADAARAIQQTRAGLLDRTSLYLPFTPGDLDEEWKQAITAF
ncbi:MAG: TIGR03617 family F420-dependent LLM class oxidoreductase [Chloroflexota bacterium]|nr:TIGR03617 family F420-dependent LLM class oxidoreductase [Chloroflexota bacterium]MDQ5867254.1 TIGR03617 family F420-dependent LLM class oxidoreductase [Chloroflexota bacterium]